jgi:hypothetical protein
MGQNFSIEWSSKSFGMRAIKVELKAWRMFLGLLILPLLIVPLYQLPTSKLGKNL